MASYNCEEYIGETIESIIQQTISDWELILIDDASMDNTREIIRKFKDARIKYIRNKENKGLAASLNIGLKEAKGEYICRIDSDDIMYINRLEKQLLYLENNKEIAIVGSNLHLFGEEFEETVTTFPQSSKKLFAYLPFYSPLPHPTWMIRRSAFADSDLKYDETFRTSQDYEFLYRLFIRGGKIFCIKEPLVKYRMSNDSISHKGKKADLNTFRVQKQIVKLLHISLSDNILFSLNYLKAKEKHDFISFLKCLYVYWLIFIKNMIYGVFDRPMLSKLIINHIIMTIKFSIKCLIKRC